MTETDQLYALAHMAACGALAWCCLCRISAMSKDTTRFMTRAAYAVLFADAVAVATMPMWVPEFWGRWAALSLTGGYVFVMVVNSPGWAHGPPEHARTAPSEFDSLPHHHWEAVIGRGEDKS